MRSKGIVVDSPLLNQDFSLLQRVEHFAGKELVSQLGIEAFTITVLPWTARFDVEGLDAQPRKPGTQGLLNEFRAIVRPDVIRWPMFEEQICQDLQHNPGIKPTLYPYGQTFPCELINHTQHTEGAAIMGAIQNKVIAPHMVSVLWPQANAGTVIQP